MIVRTQLRRLARLAREALLLELALYLSLARWLLRRPDVPAGAQPIGYSQLAAPVVALWIFGSAVEVVVADVLLSRLLPALRMPVLFIGVWGLLWMLGLLASYRVRPHLLTATELRIRSGARTRAEVPVDTIRSTSLAEHDLPGVVRSLHVEDDLLLVGVSSRTNLRLELTGPTPVRTNKGTVTVSRVGLWVDDPRATAAQLRRCRPAPTR